ncbi:MAG: hypothetical protein QM493_02485 [Sulfurovum sp.]
MEKREHNFSTKEGTIEAIKFECIQQYISLPTQIAYVLATVEHETNGTFKPVIEAYWLSDSWRKSNLRYYPFYGRGFVQITWKKNYRKYSKILNVDMIKNPDIALRPNVSLFILVHGFKNGVFTGKKIERYINNKKADFLNARRCINGKDKREYIASLAKKWLDLLT